MKRVVETTVKVSDIKLNPLSGRQKANLIKKCFDSYAEQIKPNELVRFFSKLDEVVTNYINEYEKAWQQFNRVYQFEQMKSEIDNRFAEMKKSLDDSNASSEEYKKMGYAKVKAYQNLSKQSGSSTTKKAENLIRTLEKGNIILEYLRQLVTGQTISTEFTIKGRKGIFRVPKSEVNYQLVLSTYGASGNNLVSLAYDVNITSTIKKMREDISKEKRAFSGVEISGDDIYTQIWNAKDEYLRKKSEDSNKTYYKYFDSKDAEIFDLALQTRMQEGEKFNVSDFISDAKYSLWRQQMGGSGGIKTTAYQSGDIGLIQDKMVTASTHQVNFARQTQILRYFTTLKKALSGITNGNFDSEKIKNALLELFTVSNKSVITEKITQEVNEAAQDCIEKLFNKFKTSDKKP